MEKVEDKSETRAEWGDQIATAQKKRIWTRGREQTAKGRFKKGFQNYSDKGPLNGGANEESVPIRAWENKRRQRRTSLFAE